MVIETVARTDLTPYPDERGRFGRFGGQYAPETLMPALDELKPPGMTRSNDVAYHAEIAGWRADYVGRPTPLYEARTADRRSRRSAHLPETGRSRPHRRAQDQQRPRPGAAGQAHGQAPHHRRDRRRAAWRRHRHRLRPARSRMHRLHGRSRYRAAGAECLPHEAARRGSSPGHIRLENTQGRHQRSDPRLGHQRRHRPSTSSARPPACTPIR